ncbi:hypothetical protein QQP08_002288 [Theobroma cacao]|nr:hypothetical protein QQP08_002288 [Theobroma cacao]
MIRKTFLGCVIFSASLPTGKMHVGVLETSPERVKRLNGQLTNGKRGNFVITFLQEAPMLTVTNQVTNQNNKFQ